MGNNYYSSQSVIASIDGMDGFGAAAVELLLHDARHEPEHLHDVRRPVEGGECGVRLLEGDVGDAEEDQVPHPALDFPPDGQRQLGPSVGRHCHFSTLDLLALAIDKKSMSGFFGALFRIFQN